MSECFHFARNLAKGLAALAAVSFICTQIRADSLIGVDGINLIVERNGGKADYTAGSGSLNLNTAPVGTKVTAVYFDDFTLTGTRTQTIALPTVSFVDGNGTTQHAFGAVGTTNRPRTSAQFMQLSADGRYLLTGGFDGEVSTSLYGAATGTPPLTKVIARVDLFGNVDTSTQYGTGNSTSVKGQPRTVASVDGSSFYVQGDGALNRVAFGTSIATTPSATSISSAASRAAQIYGGKLFISSTSSTVLGSGNSAGMGVLETTSGQLPTSSSGVSFTPFALTATGGVSGPAQFALLDRNPSVGFDGTSADTLYLAINDAVSGTVGVGGGGVQKWTFDGSAWSLQYTLNNGLTNTATDSMEGGIEGLTFVRLDPVSGNPVLAGTTVGTSSGSFVNSLVLIEDAGAASTFVKLADSPTNSEFRGVAVLAPEPSSLGLLCVGVIGLLKRRKR